MLKVMSQENNTVLYTEILFISSKQKPKTTYTSGANMNVRQTSVS